MKLDLHVSQLNRVGKAIEKRLFRLGISTVRDLLFHFPSRYEDFSDVSAIMQLKDGMETTVKGIIGSIANKYSPRKRKMITEAIITDDSCEYVRAVWFGQPFIAKQLKVGDEVYISGKVRDDIFGLQMVSSTYEKAIDKRQDTTHTARIVPIYPVTAGITQKQIRILIKQVVPFAKKLDDWIPVEILNKVDIIGLSEALEQIHFPKNFDSIKNAEKRLKFDELFLLQLRAEMIRQQVRLEIAPMIRFDKEIIRQFVTSLSFELTKSQNVSAWEILQDMEKSEPMNRLLEGDVGSGKTVVSAMATLDAVSSNYQVAIMAPTEILAKQHFSSFKTLFPKTNILLLTGSDIKQIGLNVVSASKKKQRVEVINYIKNGYVQIVIGTHALLTGSVYFKNLGLVIVDEQHRFGVDQRKMIREKSGNKNITPHFLSMTATPIPRSLALTLYGDLDLSIINEMPVGRKTVKTRVVDANNREKAYSFIRGQVEQGRQVFVICPLIERQMEDVGSDLYSQYNLSESKTVMKEYEKLSQYIFPDLRISYLHGKMSSAEKEKVMMKFVTKEIDILVSTSVVEVGVDIPNASLILIEGAENFGLAQLHQFRGRVGRGDYQSYCFLFTDSDSQKVRDRLDFFEKNTDGFKVAEYDLNVRGPGQVYGRIQSGMGELRFASIRDGELIKLAREIAKGIDFKKNPSIRKRVEEWNEVVHLE